MKTYFHISWGLQLGRNRRIFNIVFKPLANLQQCPVKALRNHNFDPSCLSCTSENTTVQTLNINSYLTVLYCLKHIEIYGVCSTFYQNKLTVDQTKDWNSILYCCSFGIPREAERNHFFIKTLLGTKFSVLGLPRDNLLSETYNAGQYRARARGSIY